MFCWRMDDTVIKKFNTYNRNCVLQIKKRQLKKSILLHSWFGVKKLSTP